MKGLKVHQQEQKVEIAGSGKGDIKGVTESLKRR